MAQGADGLDDVRTVDRRSDVPAPVDRGVEEHVVDAGGCPHRGVHSTLQECRPRAVDAGEQRQTGEGDRVDAVELVGVVRLLDDPVGEESRSTRGDQLAGSLVG
jgi:hypothetical protein